MKQFRWHALTAVAVQIITGTILWGACPNGNYKWGAMSKSDATNLPNPASGTAQQGGNGCSTMTWSLVGSKGDFTGSANAENTGCLVDYNQTTETRTATGYKQVLMGNWDQGTGACKPAAPTNARVTGQADANCSASVSLNANQGYTLSTIGSCAATARAKVEFSGVVDMQSIDVHLNPTFSEGATTIGGTMTFLKTPEASVTLTGTITSGVASHSLADSISRTDDYDGNIAGKLQKAFGTCIVRATADNGALNTQSDAETQITLVKLANPSGGTVVCSDDTCNVDTVATMQH